MINLLPDERKAEIRAGRTNVLLLRYIFITLTAVVVLGGLLAGSYVVLDGAKQSAQLKVSENQSRVSAYNDVRSQADSFRKDLATAKTVLDDDTSFTGLIYKIANIVPRNVILDDLNLDPATFGSDTTITASAKTFADAGKLKDSFTKNGEVFSSVQIQSLTSSESAPDNDYPIKVILKVVFNKGILE
jgi:hypothetical protein